MRDGGVISETPFAGVCEADPRSRHGKEERRAGREKRRPAKRDREGRDERVKLHFRAERPCVKHEAVNFEVCRRNVPEKERARKKVYSAKLAGGREERGN